MTVENSMPVKDDNSVNRSAFNVTFNVINTMTHVFIGAAVACAYVFGIILDAGWWWEPSLTPHIMLCSTGVRSISFKHFERN